MADIQFSDDFWTKLTAQLRRDEGVRYVPYLDSKQIPTIGIGHKILPTENFSWAVPISDGQVNLMFKADMLGKIAGLETVPWFVDLDECRQGALCNMAFNLGVVGLLKFVHMCAAIANKDWVTAHNEALNSEWAQDPPVGVGKDRSDRLATQILVGEWQ